MKFLEPMIIAFSMYSKIPMPRIEWNKENMKYTMCFFPLIGVVTGAIIYLAGMFLDGNIFSKVHSGRLMFAAVMTLIPVFVSGGIHLDGFMDTMDALGSWGDKEKKLEICLDENSYARYEVQEYRIVGSSVDSYNDIDRTEVFIEQLPTKETSGVYQVNLAPHSINVIDFKIL